MKWQQSNKLINIALKERNIAQKIYLYKDTELFIIEHYHSYI